MHFLPLSLIPLAFPKFPILLFSYAYTPLTMPSLPPSLPTTKSLSPFLSTFLTSFLASFLLGILFSCRQHSPPVPEALHPEDYTLPLLHLSPLPSPEIFQELRFLFEWDPSLSFSLLVPFHWTPQPQEALTTPSSKQLTCLSRFYEKQSAKSVYPLLEVFIFPLRYPLNPQDWLNSYLQRHHFISLKFQEEVLSHRQIYSVLFLSPHKDILGRLSAFIEGKHLWLISFTCKKEQYREKADLFTQILSSFLLLHPQTPLHLEWTPLPLELTEFGTFYYPHFFRCDKANFPQLLFTHLDFPEVQLEVEFLPQLSKKTSSFRRELKFTRTFQFSTLTVKLLCEHSLTPPQEWLILEFPLESKSSFHFCQMTLTVPPQEKAELLWMENKYILEKMLQFLLEKR